MADNPTPEKSPAATSTTPAATTEPSKPVAPVSVFRDGGSVQPATEVPPPEVHSDDVRPEPKPESAEQAALKVDWRTGLPPELAKEKSLESYKGKDATEVLPIIAKSLVEAQKLVGGSVRIPADNATPEEKAKFWKKIGNIPDKVEDYKLTAPILPNGMTVSDDILTGVRDKMHAANIPLPIAQKVLDGYADLLKATMPDYQKLADDCIVAIKDGTEQPDGTRVGGWGAATDRNLGVAKRALFTVFGRETASKVEQTALGSDPDFVRGMYQVGKLLIEEGQLPESLGQGIHGETAQSELNKIMSDMKHPYWVKGAPGHDAAVARVRDLTSLATPY